MRIWKCSQAFREIMMLRWNAFVASPAPLSPMAGSGLTAVQVCCELEIRMRLCLTPGELLFGHAFAGRFDRLHSREQVCSDQMPLD